MFLWANYKVSETLKCKDYTSCLEINLGIKFLMMMMMMVMNCFCGMVDWRKTFSHISSQDHCQRSSPLGASYMLRAGFEPAQNLSSGLVEWSCAVVITTTPHYIVSIIGFAVLLWSCYAIMAASSFWCASVNMYAC